MIYYQSCKNEKQGEILEKKRGNSIKPQIEES